MIVAKTSLTSGNILVEVLPADVEILGGGEQKRLTEATGIEDNFREAFARAKAVIREIAADFATPSKIIR